MKYNILLGNTDDDDKELAILEALASTISDEEEKEEEKCADENVSISKATAISIKKEPDALIKSVICTKCGQLYSSAGNLQKHMKSVHGNVKFRCDQCPYEASQKIGLV